MIRPITIRRARTASAAVAAVGLLAACGGDSGGSAERFCGEIDVNRAALTSPDLRFTDDVEELLVLYRSIGELAPLAIEEEWSQLIVNYETASTVVPGDPASMQLVVVTALESEAAAARVGEWLMQNCGVDLGPLATLVDHSS
ncbi:MAG: hypothetical protein ACE37B_04275 [Ilumatobacter sp.]|uniref:hypothetical protein n=1 Tax=Ilumatobacter sp. TaxID=1967498 RepID=UPI00391C999B